MSGVPSRKQVTGFVQQLQHAVVGTPRGALAHLDLSQAIERNLPHLEPSDVTLRVHSENGEAGTLRVLNPTPSVVHAEIDSKLDVDSVEFYLTRPGADGIAETRLLGLAKYPDSQSQWGVRFTTDRFAVSPTDAHVVHAEIFGPNRDLLAVSVMNVIC